jgi:uncharacterized membrane protein YfcA
MTSLSLFLVGTVIGVLSAMLGIGGGIILVPALVILFGLSQTEAQGTSLATIPFGAIIAAMLYNQNTPLRAPVIVAVAAGFVAGAYLGAKLVPYAPESELRTAFGGLMLYLGLLFVFDLRPSQPVGLVLAPVTGVIGWLAYRFRRRPAPLAHPDGGHEYYI